jgi:transcriptional regulator with XRE-family HTH domain
MTDTTQAAVIGRNIRAARLALGWSQPQLGRALGVTKGAVLNWEKGRTRLWPGGLTHLAAVLGVTVGQLLGEDGETR